MRRRIGIFGASEEALDLIADFEQHTTRLIDQIRPGIYPIQTLADQLLNLASRICGSLRVKEAMEAGFDETMYRAIANHEKSDFSPAIKAALRLCDAIIMHPGRIEPSLREELAKHFTDRQIVEIAVDVTKWSQQKALVALRIEPPASDEHLTQLIFGPDGHPAIGEPLPAVS